MAPSNPRCNHLQLFKPFFQVFKSNTYTLWPHGSSFLTLFIAFIIIGSKFSFLFPIFFPGDIPWAAFCLSLPSWTHPSQGLQCRVFLGPLFAISLRSPVSSSLSYVPAPDPGLHIFLCSWFTPLFWWYLPSSSFLKKSVWEINLEKLQILKCIFSTCGCLGIDF